MEREIDGEGRLESAAHGADPKGDGRGGGNEVVAEGHAARCGLQEAERGERRVGHAVRVEGAERVLRVLRGGRGEQQVVLRLSVANEEQPGLGGAHCVAEGRVQRAE